MYKALVVLGLLLASLSTANAQTYQASNLPFLCDAASTHPITTFGEFKCRGVAFTGTPMLLYFYGSSNSFDLFNGPTGTIAGTFTVTNFVQPSGGNLGAFAFSWTGKDSNGKVYSGTISGDWQDVIRSSWYHPNLVEALQLTVNQ